MKEWFQKKCIDPLVQLLVQDITPEKIAWSLAAGVVCSCFPILGATTVLCFITAALFRLNHVAIQIANYAGYPLQILLMIPFFLLGNKIFGYESLDFDLSAMSIEFQIDPTIFLERYLGVLFRGVVVWMFVAPIAAVILYQVFRYFLQTLFRKTRLPSV